MKKLIESFSIRAECVANIQTLDEVIRSFSTILIGLHKEPASDTKIGSSFTAAYSGYDISGDPMPEHQIINVDILRQRGNG